MRGIGIGSTREEANDDVVVVYASSMIWKRRLRDEKASRGPKAEAREWTQA